MAKIILELNRDEYTDLCLWIDRELTRKKQGCPEDLDRDLWLASIERTRDMLLKIDAAWRSREEKYEDLGLSQYGEVNQDVKNFINQNLDLVPYLISLPSEIEHYFGAEFSLILWMTEPPMKTRLVVGIQTNISKAVAIYYDFLKGWSDLDFSSDRRVLIDLAPGKEDEKCHPKIY